MSEALTHRLYPEYKALPKYQPQPCQQCQHDAQTIYWRTFTQASLDTFIQNGYQSTIPDFQYHGRQIVKNNMFIVPPNTLNTPGNLWCTPDPAFALSMGLSRGIAEYTSVYLLGFNHCKHDEEEGINGFRVFDKSNLIPLHHSKFDRGIFFSSGTIFNRLSPKQIANGVFEPIDPKLIQNLRAIAESVANINNVRLYELTQTLNTVFTYMGIDYKYIENADPYVFTDIFATTLVKFCSCEDVSNVNQEVFQKQFCKKLKKATLTRTKSNIFNRITTENGRYIEKQIETLMNDDRYTMDPFKKQKMNDLTELLKLFEFYLYDYSEKSHESIVEKCIEIGIDVIPWLQMFDTWKKNN